MKYFDLVVMYMLVRTICVFAILICVTQLLAQTRLKYFEILERNTPLNELHVAHQDCAVIVVHSAIQGLYFESNMSQIKTQEHSPRESRYRIYIYPHKQIITVKAVGFREAALPIFSNPVQRGIYTFEINEAVPVSGKGNYTLTSDPMGAEIAIDGIPDVKVYTPHTFEGYIANNYSVTLKLKGYEDYKHSMQIVSGETGSHTARLIATYGELIVSTEPQNCELYINDVFVANTPIGLVGPSNGLRPGSYKLSLKKERHLQQDAIISIEAGQRNSQSIILNPLYVDATITSEPTGSSVWIDNKLIGVTPLVLAGETDGLDAGEFMIRVVPSQGSHATIDDKITLRIAQKFTKHYIHEENKVDRVVLLPSDETELNRLPGIVSITSPKYPAIMRNQGVKGTAVVKVYLREDGSIEKIDLVESLQPGKGGLDSLALKALENAVYSPAKKNGMYVKSSMTVCVDFINNPRTASTQVRVTKTEIN